MPARRDIALIAISVVVASAVAEIGLRIADISYPIFHQMEPLRGWAPLPGVSGVWRTEGEAHVANNREGFRDREHEIAKPPGTYRIAVLGDSMTEALAVPVSATFWSIMERDLTGCERFQGRDVEVLNFGVSGYGLAQERRTLQHNALKYQPDLVLLALFTGNDIQNSERTLDGHKDRVYFVLENGVLTLDDSNTRDDRFVRKKTWRTIRNTVINASNLFQIVREGSTRLRNLFRGGKSPDGAVFNAEDHAYGVFREPDTPEWQRGWMLTEALINAIRSDSTEPGAAFMLTVLPGPVQVYPDPAVRKQFAAALDVPDLGYADRRLTAFAKREGIQTVALTEVLRRHADATGNYRHGFPNTVAGTGHWNREGHRIAGETLARTICDGATDS